MASENNRTGNVQRNQNEPDSFMSRLSDDSFRFYFQLTILSAVLGAAALFMALLNVVTGKTALMIATFAFSAVSFTNLGIMLRRRKLTRLNYALIEVSFCILFGYFLITGGTAGFSPLWILILPAFGMLFLGRKRGAILTIGVFLFVTLMLNVPYFYEHFVICRDYSNEFRMRFPVVYFAFGVIGTCFELIRSATQKALIQAKNQMEQIAVTDTLTGVMTRYGFNNRIWNEYGGQVSENDGLMFLLDLDFFKKINDLYGHTAGDRALIAVSGVAAEYVGRNGLFCRWGGEEFLGFIPDFPNRDALPFCEEVRKKVASLEIDDGRGNTFSLSVSIGAILFKAGEEPDLEIAFSFADEKLYEAKHNGRNCVVYADYADLTKDAVSTDTSTPKLN